MFRGLLIVLVTLALLIATVVGVVAAGMRRIAAEKRLAEANWHRPDPAATLPSTNPFATTQDADDPEPPPRVFESIDLQAPDAQLHGDVNLTTPKSYKPTREPPTEPRALAKWQQLQRMGGRATANYLTGFRGKDDYAEWPITINKPGDYEIDLTYACPTWEAGGHFLVKIADKEVPVAAEATRHETSFRVVPVGKVTLPAGTTTLSLRGDPISIKSHSFLNLRSVQLIPAPAAPPAP